MCTYTLLREYSRFLTVKQLLHTCRKDILFSVMLHSGEGSSKLTRLCGRVKRMRRGNSAFTGGDPGEPEENIITRSCMRSRIGRKALYNQERWGSPHPGPMLKYYHCQSSGLRKTSVCYWRDTWSRIGWSKNNGPPLKRVRDSKGRAL